MNKMKENDTRSDDHNFEDVITQNESIGHDPEDLEFLQPRPGDVVLSSPKPPQRLESFSVICIICNRMIGMLSESKAHFL